MEKVYVGVRRCDGTAGVRVQERDVLRTLPLRLDLWAHSPTGHEWGYSGSGAAQLALALLADASLCDGLAIEYHQRFKASVIAKLPRAGWEISERFVLLWLASQLENDLGLSLHLTVAEENGRGVDFA